MSCENCKVEFPGEVIHTDRHGKCSNCGDTISSAPKSQLPLGHCLNEAKQIINGERQDQYGNPEDSFAKIAEYWDTYLRQNHETFNGGPLLKTIDVAHMMMLFKIARMSGQEVKRDNYVDLCGYASIVADRLIQEDK